MAAAPSQGPGTRGGNVQLGAATKGTLLWATKQEHVLDNSQAAIDRCASHIIKVRGGVGRGGVGWGWGACLV